MKLNRYKDTDRYGLNINWRNGKSVNHILFGSYDLRHIFHLRNRVYDPTLNPYEKYIRAYSLRAAFSSVGIARKRNQTIYLSYCKTQLMPLKMPNGNFSICKRCIQSKEALKKKLNKQAMNIAKLNKAKNLSDKEPQVSARSKKKKLPV